MKTKAVGLKVFFTVAALMTVVTFTAAISYGIECREPFVKKSLSQLPPMKRFETVFGTKSPIIGMIHLAGKSNKEVLARALDELALLEKKGVHAAIIENYHGSLSQVEAVMAAAQGRFPKLTLGVNVLPNDYATAFNLARRYGAKFIQLDYVSGKYEGYRRDITELNAKEYYKYRRAFPEILVLGGVHPKYYQPIDGSSLRRDLKTAQGRADAIVVTGAGTGKETPFQKIGFFRETLGKDFPLVIGAGVTAENGRDQLKIGNGAIVGSFLKDGDTRAPIIENRIGEILKLSPSFEQERSNDSNSTP